MTETHAASDSLLTDGTDVCLSVVIPTFNRADSLIDTVRSVFESDLPDRLDRLELIVVDDGSAVPARDVLASVETPSGWDVRVVRQPNAGVGAARNRGYHVAVGRIVLFVDDDMLVLPGTLRAHLEAHRLHPNSVVFGRSPYIPQPRDRFVDWVLALANDPHHLAAEAIVPAVVIASGHLSVERAGAVGDWVEFYADDMRTPVAEEYELSSRLRRHGVPVLVGRDIVAFHNRTIDVDAFLRQQYGHGRGCAEAARVHPESLALPELRRMITHHQRRSARAVVWRVLRTAPARTALRTGAHLGRRGLLGPLAPVVFRAAAGAWFASGLRSA